MESAWLLCLATYNSWRRVRNEVSFGLRQGKCRLVPLLVSLLIGFQLNVHCCTFCKKSYFEIESARAPKYAALTKENQYVAGSVDVVEPPTDKCLRNPGFKRNAKLFMTFPFKVQYSTEQLILFIMIYSKSFILMLLNIFCMWRHLIGTYNKTLCMSWSTLRASLLPGPWQHCQLQL